MLDKVPSGPMFISFCFLVRAMDAIGFAAAITASFSILAKAFPSNIATVLVSSKNSVTAEYQQCDKLPVGSLKPGGENLLSHMQPYLKSSRNVLFVL